MIRICDTCGDSYIMRLAGRNAARDKAKKLANEIQTPYAVCEEAGEYFCSAVSVAITHGFKIVEVISGLPRTT